MQDLEYTPSNEAEQGDTRKTLFEGDTGELPKSVRDALVTLLRGPCVESRDDEKRWNTILINEKRLRSALHDLYLNLIIDKEEGVAFVRQITPNEELKNPILMQRHTMVLHESMLVVFLRRKLLESSSKGERAVIEKRDMHEYLKPFYPDSNDEALAQKRRDSYIDKFTRYGFLRKIPGTDDRLEVSPIVKLIFTAQDAEVLLKSCQNAGFTDILEQHVSFDSSIEPSNDPSVDGQLQAQQEMAA